MFALSLTMFLVVTGAFPAPPTVKDVAWISGCWGHTRNTRHVAEHWLPAEGGTMIGVSRTVNNGKTTEWEFLIIREGAKGLDYVAKPSGQPEATFTAATASATEVVLENPAHDFPKKIGYKRDGDSLTAWIEGHQRADAQDRVPPQEGELRRLAADEQRGQVAGVRCQAAGEVSARRLKSRVMCG